MVTHRLYHSTDTIGKIFIRDNLSERECGFRRAPSTIDVLEGIRASSERDALQEMSQFSYLG